MEMVINWVKAHGFPYKVVDGHLYWQTSIQTGEATPDGHLVWHSKNFFNEV